MYFEMDKPGSKLHKKDVVEGVTILEAPPMICVGMVGYMPTTTGMRGLTTIWAAHLSENLRRRFYKNWYMSKKKAFTKYLEENKEKYKDGGEWMGDEMDRIKQNCTVVRAIMHTQPNKVHNHKQKRAQVIEIQINGGSVADKVDFCKGLFEQEVPLSSVFEEDEMTDVIGVTKGHGWDGVVTRWGVSRLPRKTHRGLRKVACIGAWHPARVQWQVARAGQRGYHQRTAKNKKIYRLGKKGNPNDASTDADLTAKAITPIGGFPHYGVIREDWCMLKGSIQGPPKRVITLRKSYHVQTTRNALEKVSKALKFIDTASKIGHGRFQTLAEKGKFFGPLKKDLSV
eukprot:Platyproteum_vivax@DN1998_c0_g1_i1.p1